jgi:ribosomal protein L12E/L44/L45/RPP1/RPP2
VRGAEIDRLAASLEGRELDDVVEDIEALLDAQAGGVIDLSPAFERLLLDLLEQTVVRR